MSVWIRVNGLNPEEVTVQDCIEIYRQKGMSAVLNDGRVVGFKGNGPAGEGIQGRARTGCVQVLL